MSTPGGLAESAAETVVRLMMVEMTGVDTGYIGRLAALGAAGDPQRTRHLEARLTDDTRSLEASMRGWLSEIANVAPAQLRPDLRPMSEPEIRFRCQDLVEQLLMSGRLRPADLNAFLAEFAGTADEGHQLLTVVDEMAARRNTMWHNTQRSTTLPPPRDMEELRRLDGKRRRLWDQIRSRYPVTVRAERVQSALERQYERQRAELVAAQEQCTSAEDRAGYAAALQQLDSAHELALRRQSVPQHDVPPQPAAARSPMVAQLEQQRAQMVRMRDQDLTAEGRAAYDQAIAQIDVSMAMAAQQQAQAAAAMSAMPAMTDDQRRAADAAMADVARATAQLGELGVAANAAMEAGSAMSAHMVSEMNVMSGITAELGDANLELHNALTAQYNAKTAMDNARLSGTQADVAAAARYHEQARQRHTNAEARVAELEGRLDEQQKRFGQGPR